MTIGSCFSWCTRQVLEQSGFLTFLQEHEIPLEHLLMPSVEEEPRFFRIKKSLLKTDGNKDSLWKKICKNFQTVQEVTGSIEKEKIVPTKVSWVPGFYSIPASIPLARTEMYQKGEIYGMDISSGYAVTLLNIQPGEHVLDLCCAPGAKLTMIADLLEKKGSITGVDFSRQRLGAAKQLVHKYGLVFPPVTSSGSPTDSEDTWRCRLFHADGQTFSIGPLTDYRDPKEEEKDQNKEEEENNGTEELEVEVFVDTKEILQRSTRHARKRKRMNKSARARAKKTQKKWFFHEKLYDKVLVDAECTHDGSIKHLQKLETLKDWTDYVTNHLNKKEIHRILCLQQALIQNGFRLLKEKGILIYSTCSLSTLQNERVVSNFLASNPDAILQKIDPPANIPCISSPQVNGTIRFTPSKQTSGLFIAKFIKKK